MTFVVSGIVLLSVFNTCKCLELMAKLTLVWTLSGSDLPQKIYPLYYNGVSCLWEKKNFKNEKDI